MAAAKFWVVSFAAAAAGLVLTRGLIGNEYFFFAGYVVLQYIVLSTAWNILGGYTGYTNFGVGAFFAVGAYSAVVLHKLTSLPVPVMILVAGLTSGILGFGMGYLTLRLKGVFFAIATLALAIVAQTLIVNWDFVGGSRGIYIIRPAQSPIHGGYIQYLYSLMLLLSWLVTWRSVSTPTIPAKPARITNVSAAEPPASRQRIGTDLYAENVARAADRM